MLKSNSTSKYITSLFLLFSIGFISYGLKRHETNILLPTFIAAFGFYWWLHKKSEQLSLKEIFIIGVLCRIILIPLIPNLSDDVYRFIWDGRLLAQGISPFEHVPAFYQDSPDHGLVGLNTELFTKLNSPYYFTVYPPVAQFIFLISAFMFPNSILGSIITIRLFHILADLGVFYFVVKILKINELNPKLVLLYFLNPLVILELTGNIHAESILLLFLMGGIYFYKTKRHTISAIFWSLSIATKLIPLIFLPLLFFKESWKERFYFFIPFIVVTILLFLPLYDHHFINGITSSLSLYFQSFEFNASIYYLVREIGYMIKGYNIIGTAGIILALTSFLSIITISIISSIKKWNIEASLLLIFMAYFLLANTLHPWYIVSILALSVLLNLRFGVIWTLFIFMTYAGYTITGFNENMWVVITEYVITIGLFLYEMKRIDLKEYLNSSYA